MYIWAEIRGEHPAGWDEGIEPDEGVRLLNWKLRCIAHVVVCTVLAILMLLTFGKPWILIRRSTD